MTQDNEPSLRRKTRIDQIASEFERLWRTNDRLTVEDLLARNRDIPTDELLRELLLLEIELQKSDGVRVTRGDYRGRFPDSIKELDFILDEAGLLDESMATILSSSGDTSPNEQTLIGRYSGHTPDETPEKSTLSLGAEFRPDSTLRARLIGDFEIIEPIGEGGMGIVYKARQRSLNRIVALKLIKSGITANTEELRRFQTEAEAAAKLNHPNILPVYEFGRHGDSTLYIAMPFIQGKTLREKLGSHTMAPQAAATMLLTLSRAVVHAHERQILHRDLKPTNILFDEHQNPLIMDFGLACDLSSDEHLTRTSQILGTPQFMPPEQAGQENGRTDFRSDIYALGAILYYTLRGVAPFTGASGLDVIQRVLNDDPISPRADDKSIPRDLETICLKCLRKEKEQRYQTASELAEDLQLFLEGRPIIARPLPMLERAVRWCRRRPWQAALIGLLIAFALSATATAGVMTQLRKEERDARLLAEEAKSKAQDATLMALEQQVRAQLSARDPGDVQLGMLADGTTQPSSARSVDNAYVEHERAYSLPKVLNSSAGDWGYFDFRPSPSGKLLAVCDQAGVVKILDASNGREIQRLANAATHPGEKWDMHLVFFESEHPLVKELKRPAFTFSLDWVNEESLIAVDDQKRLLKYSLGRGDGLIADHPAADQMNQDSATPGAMMVPQVIQELSEPGHLVRVRLTDGALLVCLESGALNLFGADGVAVATNSDTKSRPMNCQYQVELKLWIVSFDNGDVVVLDDRLTPLARLSTGSSVYCVAMSRNQDQWVADVACAHRPVVRYAWDSEDRTFTEIVKFDLPSRMYDHYFTAITSSADRSQLFARDNKGHLVAWNTKDKELLGLFPVTHRSNSWLMEMKATLRWPPILDRNPSFVDLTQAGRLRAVDSMGVIMEFSTDGPRKPPTWKTLNIKLGVDPSLSVVTRSPNLFWALDAAGTLSKIDGATGTVLLAVPGAHPGPVPSLVTMNDGRLVTVSGDRTLRVWSTDDGQPREVRRIEHERNLISLAVHEDTHRLAAMDEAAVVSLWNSETGGQIASASLFEFAVPDAEAKPQVPVLSARPYTGRIAFNLTGQYLAAYGAGQQFEIVDCDNGLKAVKVGGQHEARAQGGTVLCWSGTNPWRLLEGDEFGTGAAWIEGKEPASHTSNITGSWVFGGYPADCRQTPDKGRLCLLMKDGSMVFGTAEHFVPTILLDTGVRDANSFCIGSTGQTLLVAGRDGTLRSAVFADFSLPDEATLTKLKGTRHELLSLKKERYPKASSISIPAMNSSGQGTLAILVTEESRSSDGGLFLIRRREEAWRLDPVLIPNSPGTDGPHVHFESPGTVFSRDDRAVVALRQALPTGGYDGRLLLAREQADGSWETDVVLESGNEGHTCFPIRDPDGDVNSVLHFDYGSPRFRHSRRGPLINNNWPTETLAKGRGFRLNGFQTSDGTVHVCGNSFRGGGDYAPDRYLIMRPGKPLQWEYAPGQILRSLSDGTPVLCNSNAREAACGNIYRRKADEWELWTKIPGSFSEQRVLSQIFITPEDDIWLADYRHAAKRLYAWNFRAGEWSCYEIEVGLPDLITMTSCWVESKDRLAIVISGASSSEAGGIDVIETVVPNAVKAP